jgi:hypothetical protein
MPTSNGKARYLESLNARIEDALRAVGVAHEELAAAVNALVSVGDKKVIIPGREISFEKLRVAENYVRDLRQLLART